MGKAVVVSCFVAAALIYALRLTQNVPTTGRHSDVYSHKRVYKYGCSIYMAKECRLSLGVCFSLFLFMMRCDALRFCDGLCEELKFVRLALHFIWLNCKLVWLGSRGSWLGWLGCLQGLQVCRVDWKLFTFFACPPPSSSSLVFPEEHEPKAAKGRQESQDQRIDAYLWSLFSLWPGWIRHAIENNNISSSSGSSSSSTTGLS